MTILPSWEIISLIFHIDRVINNGTSLWRGLSFDEQLLFHHLWIVLLSCKKGFCTSPTIVKVFHNLLAITQVTKRCSKVLSSELLQQQHFTSSTTLILTRISPIRILFFHILQRKKENLKGTPLTQILAISFLSSHLTHPNH